MGHQELGRCVGGIMDISTYPWALNWVFSTQTITGNDTFLQYLDIHVELEHTWKG